MFDNVVMFRSLGFLIVGAPLVLFTILGLTSLFRRQPLSERAIAGSVQVAIVTGLIASVAMLISMLVWDDTQVPIELGSWVHVHDYHFVFKFEFDRLSIPFVILTFLLCGTIGAFANRYMHRERGFNRFFILLSLFVVGMVTTSLAGTVETLFCGWELVGLSSALLVAFFHERPGPVINGLHVWVVYRISDVALLLASIMLHRMTGHGDFDSVLKGDWPFIQSELGAYQALLVGLLLLIAAMGKSAMVPFSGWLPRAMEGPTPSSAIFYGALSVHLGAFLLLRFSPFLYQSPLLRLIVIAVGISTAVFATFAGEVQTDVKSALSFASLTQVGIIFAEIGCGFQYLALVHILGHGCLRTLQFLRAPSLLHDYRVLEDAIGDRLPRFTGVWLGKVDDRSRVWFYRLALERGYLDNYLKEKLVRPFLRFLQRCDALERTWANKLAWPTRKDSLPPETKKILEETL